MRKLHSTILLLVAFTKLTIAQDSNVTVIESGDGNTKTNAVNQALRNCIEKSMGAFLSSSTVVSNDSLVKDQIITIASGNIIAFDILSEIKQAENWNVTVSAIISPEKLITTLKSNGYDFELNGGVYAQNILKEKYYANQEIMALENFISIWKNIQLFDFKINVLEPRVIANYFNGGSNVWGSYSIDSYIVEALRAQWKESYELTKQSYKLYNIEPEKTYRNQDDPYFSNNMPDRRSGKSTDIDTANKYSIVVFFSPEISQNYLSFISGLIKLLGSISITNIDEYKHSNSEYLELVFQDLGLGNYTVDFTRARIEEDNFNPAHKYYLRNKSSKDIFYRINELIIQQLNALYYKSDQLEKLQTKPIVFPNNHYKFCTYDKWANDNYAKMRIYPFYYTGYGGGKLMGFSPNIIGYFLSFDELNKLKNITFLSNFENHVIK